MTESETSRSRARDLGIIAGILPPGPLNAITDVADVLIGHSTLIRGEDDFTADVVMVDGKPCAKVGREYHSNDRMELVS